MEGIPMIGVVAGMFIGGTIVWIWAMCREQDEREALNREFDDGLSQAMRCAGPAYGVVDVDGKNYPVLPANRFPHPGDPGQANIRAMKCKMLGEFQPFADSIGLSSNRKTNQSTADEVVQAINRVRRKLRQHEAVDGARAREGLSPLLFQRRLLPPPPPPRGWSEDADDEPETFI